MCVCVLTDGLTHTHSPPTFLLLFQLLLQLLLLLFKRSLVQIKSHAQKVLRRLDDGEDIFWRLRDHVAHLQTLLTELGEPFEPFDVDDNDVTATMSKRRRAVNPRPHPQRVTAASVSSTLWTHGKNRKRKQSQPQQQQQQHAALGPYGGSSSGPCEHILAASALCQLATPSTAPPAAPTIVTRQPHILRLHNNDAAFFSTLAAYNQARQHETMARFAATSTNGIPDAVGTTDTPAFPPSWAYSRPGHGFA
jgi:hypothetical protein